MKFLKTLFLSTCVIGLSACGSGEAESQLPKFDTVAMDELLSSAVERGDVIGVQALVFDEGQLVYKNNFGLADRERQTPVASDTVYRVYSMTKVVTSALIMDLMEEGKLKLSDPAEKYIPQLAQMKVISVGADGQPQYADQTRPMTIEDLLLHRAGLSYGIFGGNPIEDTWAKADLFNNETTMTENMDKLPELPLLGQPGEQWFYSFSIDILGRIVEILEGQTLEEVMQARIFKPLGMHETSFHVSEALKPRFASNYLLQEDGSFVLFEDGQTSPYTKKRKIESGGGGLVSTADDWLKFARMLLGEGSFNGVKILEPETVKLMMTDHLGDTTPLLPWVGGTTGTGFGYGAAVELKPTPEMQAERGVYEGQFGWGGAARTDFWVDPKNDSIGIIMLQFLGGGEPQIHYDFQALTLEQTRNDRE